MRTRLTTLSTVALCALAVCMTSAADKTTPSVDPSALPEFHDLWKRVEQSDTTVDFTQLRMSFTRTSSYRPYDSNVQDIRSRMDSAFNSNDFNTAVDLANKLLKKDPLQTDAHIVLDVSYEKLGDTTKSQYHHYVANGLIQSLLAKGDGLSRETAFVVISTDEEYIALNVLGVELRQQSFVDQEDHAYDVMSVYDPVKDTTYNLYFNLDLPMQALEDRQ